MCWASTRRICRRARRPARPIASTCWARRDGVPKTPEWAARDHRHAGRDHPPARRSSSPPPSPRRCSAATRPAARPTASSSTAPPTRWRAITGNVGIPGGNSGVSNGATGRSGIKSLPTGANPIDAAVATPLLADLLARGKAGGYPADIKLIYSAGGDLFNQCPNANKMVGVARRRRVHRGAGPFPDADRALRRHRAAGDDLLGAQRRAHAVGRRRPLRDLHEAGDPADVRMPQRHRHLRRPRRAALGINGYNDKTEERVAARADRGRGRRLRGLPRAGRRALRRRPRTRWPSPREIRDPERHKFTTPSGKIEIYSMALAAKPDPYGLGAIPPIPTWIAAGRAGRASTR